MRTYRCRAPWIAATSLKYGVRKRVGRFFSWTPPTTKYIHTTVRKLLVRHRNCTILPVFKPVNDTVYYPIAVTPFLSLWVSTLASLLSPFIYGDLVMAVLVAPVAHYPLANSLLASYRPLLNPLWSFPFAPPNRRQKTIWEASLES